MAGYQYAPNMLDDSTIPQLIITVLRCCCHREDSGYRFRTLFDPSGSCADEVLLNVNDLRRSDIVPSSMSARGGKDRRIRSSRRWSQSSSTISTAGGAFPAPPSSAPPRPGLAAWPSAAPLFVGADGDRISRGTLQYRVLRAFRRAASTRPRPRFAFPRLRHTSPPDGPRGVSVYT
jgi:hypothetical protein